MRGAKKFANNNLDVIVEEEEANDVFDKMI